MTPKIKIFGQNFAHFGDFEGLFLTILNVKKVDLWTFSKLIRGCLGSIQALISALKSLRLLVFSASRISK